MTGNSDTERLVRFVVTSLVDDVDAVSVAASQPREGETLYEVTVAPDDVGKVIGRQGRIIKAIRVLARAAASVDGEQVEVEVLG